MNTGVDIVSVERIEKALERHGIRFAKKILTEKELELFKKRQDSSLFLSGRFAAKEAVYKAAGISDLTWQNVEIVNNALGKPEVFLFGKQAEGLSVSISHEREFAVAFALSI